MAGAAIGAAGAIGGGILQSNAAGKAAGAQQAAAAQAAQFQQTVYNNTQQQLQPYLQSGQNASYSLAGLLGLQEPAGAPAGASGNAQTAFNQFTQTPYYQFPLQQGEQAMNQSAAARGLTLSGGQMNAMQQYGQGYASQGLGSYMGMLGNLMNLGQNSAVMQGAQGNTSSSQLAGILQQGGNASAAGTVGQGNAMNSMIGGLGGILGNGQAGNSGLLSNPQFQSWLGGNTSYSQPTPMASSGAWSGVGSSGAGAPTSWVSG